MAAPKDYTSFAELERDLVRPEMRIGWSVDEIESTGETLEFDQYRTEPLNVDLHLKRA